MLFLMLFLFFNFFFCLHAGHISCHRLGNDVRKHFSLKINLPWLSDVRTQALFQSLFLSSRWENYKFYVVWNAYFIQYTGTIARIILLLYKTFKNKMLYRVTYISGAIKQVYCIIFAIKKAFSLVAPLNPLLFINDFLNTQVSYVAWQNNSIIVFNHDRKTHQWMILSNVLLCLPGLPSFHVLQKFWADGYLFFNFLSRTMLGFLTNSIRAK